MFAGPPLAPPLRYYAFNSLLFHLFLLAFGVGLFFIEGFFWGEDREKNTILIKSSVRVDTVAMPRHTLKELKAAQIDINMTVGDKIADPLPPPPPTKGDVVFKEMLQKYASKKSVERAVFKKSKGRVSGKMEKKLKKLILAGNRLAQGASLVGDGKGEGTQGVGAKYAFELLPLLRPHWKLPDSLIEQELQCRIRIFISSRGEVIKSKVIESSGVKEYDQKALDTIKKAAPFPPPPEEFRLRAKQGAIVLGFPL